MPRCEWQNIDCPDTIYQECSLRPEIEELKAAQKLIPKGGIVFCIIEDELYELAQPLCDLEERLVSEHSIVNPEDNILEQLTDEQLAAVGAKRLEKSDVRSTDLSPLEQKILELRDPTLGLTNRQIADDVHYSPSTVYRNIRRLASLGLTDKRLPNAKPSDIKRVADREERILYLRSERPEITNEKTEEMLGASHRTVAEDIKKLIKEGKTPRFKGRKTRKDPSTM